jgi:flagellar biosynthesis GTPase FlhF
MSVLRRFFGVVIPVIPDPKTLRGSKIVQGKKALKDAGKHDVCARCPKLLKGNSQVRGGPYEYDLCNACGVKFMNSYYDILDIGRKKNNFFLGTTEQRIKNLAYDCSVTSTRMEWKLELTKSSSFDKFESEMRKIIGDHVAIPGEPTSLPAHTQRAGAADATADADDAAEILAAQRNELAEQQQQAAARAAEQRAAERREAEQREAEQRAAERREAEQREAERLKKEQSDAAERGAAADAERMAAARREKDAALHAEQRAADRLALELR